jgi:ABC-type transport system involved in cytochrome bd biosynthesis fused ATPase/permease subunit
MMSMTDYELRGVGRGPLDKEAQAKTPALVFDKLTVATSKGRPLVQNVTGVVHKGEICAVMGLSGCGKSTFLKYVPAPELCCIRASL